MSKPIIIGFGYRARSGKGECVSFLAKQYGHICNILVTSFAKALRREVDEAVAEIQKCEGVADPRQALEILCQQHNIPYDPDAVPDELYPLGKQRKLLQYWGTELRRAQDPDYWLNRVADEVREKQPDIVLIDDLRFKNEFEWIVSQGGYTVQVFRPDTGLTGEESQHVSEHSLSDKQFDFTILNNGTLDNLHLGASDVLVHALKDFPNRIQSV